MPNDEGLSSQHRVLAKDVGSWDAEVEVRFPGAPPQRSKGLAHNRLICGGQWLVSDYRSDESGFEGHGLYGYDPQLGCYTGVWVDPMRSFLAPMRGTWDADTRTMTFVGEALTPRGPIKWRETTESVDDDTRVFRSFMPAPSGGEAEVMTVVYRRRRQ
jgi:hypothetical protein